ncbi:MAG: TolC family protein [Bacteroidota bacterium]
MHNKLKFIEILLSGCLHLVLVLCANAQVDTISLQQAIESALTKNQLVAIADIEVRQNESHLQEVQSTKFPQLLLRSHYLYTPENGYSEVVTNGGEYGLQLTTGIPLYDGGTRTTVIHQASIAVDRSTIELQKSKVDLSYEVRSAYYEIVRAGNELQIRTETKQRLQDYVSFLAQLQRGGSVNASDVMKARVELNNATTDAENARQSVVNAKMSLNRLAGNPIERNFEIVSGTMSDTSSMPQFAVENSPSVQLLQHDKASSEDDLSIARNERLPTLSVAGDVGWLGVLPTEYRQNIGYSVSLSLDLPLWSWGAIENRIQQKTLSREHIDKQIELEKRDLELQWYTNLNDIAYARNALSAYASNIGEAEKNYLLAKSRFAGGSGSNLEVLDAQRLLVEIKLNYNHSLFQLNSAIARALKLSGQ